MSTDSRGSYRTTVLMTALALLVVALGLTVLLFHQPPKVAQGQIDGDLAIRRSGVTLLLTPDQAWHSAGGLTVHARPAARATAKRRGDEIFVTFAKPLRSVTSYRVSVGPVVGNHTGATGQLTYSFRTPSFPLYVLKRSGVFHDGRLDRIVDVSGGPQKTIFAAPDILEFASVGDSLVVDVARGDTDRLLAVAADGTVDKRLPLPSGRGFIRDLRAEPDAGLFGFMAGPVGSRHLFVESLKSTRLPRPVTTIDGRPMKVTGWGFVPGTRSGVVSDGADHLFLVDLAHPARQPRLLGDYSKLLGFVPGAPTLVLPHRAAPGVDMLDLHKNSSRTRLFGVPAASRSGRALFRTYALAPSRFLDLEQKWGFNPGSTIYQLVLRHHGRRQVLYATDPGVAAGLSVCVGPDGQQAAAIVTPTRGRPDGYPIAPAHTGDSVVVLDVADDDFDVVSGTTSQWCSSGPTTLAPHN